MCEYSLLNVTFLFACLIECHGHEAFWESLSYGSHAFLRGMAACILAEISFHLEGCKVRIRKFQKNANSNARTLT